MRGRPTKPAHERQRTKLTVKLTPAEMALIKHAAQAGGDKTAVWARRHLLSLARLTLRADRSLA
jgi:hypothetical protein